MSADISIDDLHIHDPREARKSAVRVLKAGIVPFLQSSPGIGKSSIMRDIAKEFNLKVIDHRLSTSSPTDLSGLPWIVDGMARFNPFEFFPIKGVDIPEGYDGWLLFLDEFNSAPKSVQAAAYQHAPELSGDAVCQRPLRVQAGLRGAGLAGWLGQG